MKRLIGIVCALAALPAGADTLTDLKGAVSRLSARQPVRATFTVDQLVKTAGRFANENTTRAVSAEVSHDAAGVTITIPQTLLDTVAKEMKSPGGGEKAQNLIGAIRTIAITEALDFRDSLLGMLDQATVVEEKRNAFQGRPARLLVLKLSPKSKKNSGTIRIGSVKTEERLKLWVGDDNLPLAAEHTQKTSAGLAFIRANYTGRTVYTFAHTPDRLILARVETNDSGSGMGQNLERTGVQTLTLH